MEQTLKTPTVLSLQDKNFTVVAHRGIPSKVGENTLESFLLAQRVGFTWGEMDIQLTVDNHMVAIHDGKVDRTTNGHGWVKDFTFKRIRTLRTTRGYKIPTPEEVILSLGQDFHHNLELKSLGTVPYVVEMLESFFAWGWSEENFLLSSFQHDELALFSTLIPKVRIGALIAHSSSNLDFVDVLNADYVNVDIGAVDTNPKFVNLCHSEGFLVGVYTIKSYDDAVRMKNYGVDLIFSNVR